MLKSNSFSFIDAETLSHKARFSESVRARKTVEDSRSPTTTQRCKLDLDRYPLAVCVMTLQYRAMLLRLLPTGLCVLLFLSGLSNPGLSAAEEKPASGTGNTKKGEKEKSKIKLYDEVITEKAETSVGLFHTHRIDDDLYYEIPAPVLGTDMLWVTQIAETTAGSSYAGMPAGNQVVRWEQRGDRVLLRNVRYGIRAETDDPIAVAVKASNLAPIIRVFEVEAYGKDKKPVIKVTDLFRKDVPEISARRSLNAGNMDTGRTFIEEVKAFPRNINVKVLASYAASSGNRGTGSTPDRGPRSSGITALIHHSMVLLPEEPMKPRRHDSRVGFFSVSFDDYADDLQHQVETIRYITRWRLEKKDPQAELSEPVEPIVFYVGRGVPEKWKPFVKAGIEEWQPAFEGVGFKNAILGKYPPDPREDPDWDAEDARISTVRWLASNVENAFGPHVHDPRTGEILEADVRMYHNVQKLVRDWYFIQASPSDERAQKLPLPDDLVGELIQFVVAHEVGHSLGFPHNMKASSSYSIEQLRDPEWTKKNGTAPSIMDYARFNYVAQPGDGAALLPKIGPYDHFAVNWGYRQFPEDANEMEELEKLVQKQIDEPMFRFGGRNPGVDSTQQTEDLGSNAVEATRLGLKNLERVSGYLVRATSEKGRDYSLLSNMYDELLAQWNHEIGHVINVVGGVKEINLYFGDADQRFFPNDAGYQRRAVEFLVQHALQTPTMLTSPDIVMRMTAEGVAERLLNVQRRVLTRLVNPTRINRMAEHSRREGTGHYRPSELLEDLRDGLFGEISEAQPNTDLYRRNLQRAYVDQLSGHLDKPAVNSDLPAHVRAELEAIREMIRKADHSGADPVLLAHLKDLEARIERALETEKKD